MAFHDESLHHSRHSAISATHTRMPVFIPMLQVHVDEEELDTALRAAITCCILAAAGPQRSRMLATLYKDERSARTPLYPMLEKVYLERILSR